MGILLFIWCIFYIGHSVIDALALGLHWRFWSFGLEGRGEGLEYFRDKGGGGGDRKWWITKKCRWYLYFELKL